MSFVRGILIVLPLHVHEHTRETLKTRPFTIALKLNFSDGCGCRCANVDFPVNFQVSP